MQNRSVPCPRRHSRWSKIVSAALAATVAGITASSALGQDAQAPNPTPSSPPAAPAAPAPAPAAPTPAPTTPTPAPIDSSFPDASTQVVDAAPARDFTLPIDPRRYLADPPPAPREFRAAWVATVVNIDWPTKPGLSTYEQQREILDILDRAKALRLNALVVQIRTTADALYQSKLEPWSQYITGTQGQAPFPYYDPLAFWIEHAHKRGIEIHAWFNPYRAKHATSKVELSSTHLRKRRPDLVKEYGDWLWLDPGEPDAAKHSLAVFMDVVERYDVDGIHIDDYFYPYPIKDAAGNEVDFPDGPSWERYQKSGGKLSRNDWRRDNINRLVREIYQGTKKRKPHVKFGISPFGIGRAGLVPGITGFDQYEKLYADAALWLREGWCDYFTPQLYWPIAQKAQSFPVLLDYWRSENPRNRYVWPGLYTSRILEEGARKLPAGEFVDQIQITRTRDETPGHVHFSMKALQKDADLQAALEKTYPHDALIPAMTWLDPKAPGAPKASIRLVDGRAELQLAPGSREPVRTWALWTRAPEGEQMLWSFQAFPGTETLMPIPADVTELQISAVDRNGNESRPVRLKVQR